MIDSPVLSVICPSIRKQNLVRLYNSVKTAFSGKFEFIVAGPYGLPDELQEKDNCVWVDTHRSPLAAQQEALYYSRGTYITYAADDGVYLPMTIDIAIEMLEPEPYTTIVTSKYFEGGDPNGQMAGDSYYRLHNHDSMRLPGVPFNCLMLNCGVINRSLLIQLGGWDSFLFSACPLGYTDFAVRAHKFGCKFILQEEVMFSCGHMPGETGDHGPIHRQQTYHDQPLFTGIYCTPELYLTRQNIKMDNWKKTPEVWGERFSNGK